MVRLSQPMGQLGPLQAASGLIWNYRMVGNGRMWNFHWWYAKNMCKNQACKLFLGHFSNCVQSCLWYLWYSNIRFEGQEGHLLCGGALQPWHWDVLVIQSQFFSWVFDSWRLWHSWFCKARWAGLARITFWMGCGRNWMAKSLLENMQHLGSKIYYKAKHHLAGRKWMTPKDTKSTAKNSSKGQLLHPCMFVQNLKLSNVQEKSESSTVTPVRLQTDVS